MLMFALGLLIGIVTPGLILCLLSRVFVILYHNDQDDPD